MSASEVDIYLKSAVVVGDCEDCSKPHCLSSFMNLVDFKLGF